VTLAMSHAGTAEMRSVERIIVRAEDMPWAIVIRMAIGYALVPAWAMLTAGRFSQWTLIPFFVGVHLALRVVLVVFRKLLPFGPTAQAAWRSRRQIGQEYDSYQWQKLLPVGLGLAIYTFQTTPRSEAQIALTVFCALSGAAALAVWRRSGGRAQSGMVKRT
jgi:hypothetical protein